MTVSRRKTGSRYLGPHDSRTRRAMQPQDASWEKARLWSGHMKEVWVTASARCSPNVPNVPTVTRRADVPFQLITSSATYDFHVGVLLLSLWRSVVVTVHPPLHFRTLWLLITCLWPGIATNCHCLVSLTVAFAGLNNDPSFLLDRRAVRRGRYALKLMFHVHVSD